MPEGGTAALVPAALRPGDPTAPASGSSPAAGDSALRARIESASGLVVAGEALHGSLLRKFYAAHNYEPVWPTRQAQADALVKLVLRSGEQGLDPALFHGALLRNPAALSPLDRELVLSDAFLAYADALARGALPIEDRMDDEDLTPGPVDVPGALDAALNSPDPAASIEALAPTSPGYLALRRALAAYLPDAQGGAAGPLSPAADKLREERLRQIVANLERWRWLPRHLPAERIWVNLATAELVFYQDDRPAFSSRVVIGEFDKQTPELETTVNSLLFNPPWNVPQSIAEAEILPKLSREPDYLNRHHMIVRANGAIEQLPGVGTALGQLKFEMQDRFDVYLHDTPLKHLFSRDNRRQSHGCVRVQNPRELAALLLQQPVEVINKAIALGYTNRRMLPAPVPVFVVYQDAFAARDGTIEFHPDVYRRDDEIWQHLHPAQQAPVAQRDAAGQRRS